MPLPTVVCLAFATGLAAALASRTELRVSPRSALLTRAFAAYAVFMFGLFVPTIAYFYVFHGDWFLVYTVDVRRVPSAIALIGLLAFGGVGATGFHLGASFARTQREPVAAGAIAAALLAAGVAAWAVRERLGHVGSYAQFHGDFGLVPFAESALFRGTLWLGAFLAAGCGYLLVRLHLAGRRG